MSSSFPTALHWCQCNPLTYFHQLKWTKTVSKKKPSALQHTVFMIVIMQGCDSQSVLVLLYIWSICEVFPEMNANTFVLFKSRPLSVWSVLTSDWFCSSLFSPVSCSDSFGSVHTHILVPYFFGSRKGWNLYPSVTGARVRLRSGKTTPDDLLTPIGNFESAGILPNMFELWEAVADLYYRVFSSKVPPSPTSIIHFLKL